MSLVPLLVTAESAVSGINPYWVGSGILLLLTCLMLGLLAFGRGREHS